MKKIILLSLVAAGMLFVGCGDKEKLETKEAVAGTVDKTAEAAAVDSTAVANEVKEADTAAKDAVH